jgi:hypothetical protein
MRFRLSAVLKQQKEHAITTSVRPLEPDRVEKLRALGYIQ